MYFTNRAQAGRTLAEQLVNYKNKNISVLALSPGGLIIGAQIAMTLHSHLVMLLMNDAEELAGVPMTALFNSSTTKFSYNDMYTPGQIESLAGHRMPLLQQKMLSHRNHNHTLLGKNGEINKDLLQRKTLIVVSDGFPTGYSLQELMRFLNDVRVHKIVVATPLASIESVDVMHAYCDELHCLSVHENYISTDHYYDDNTMPPVKDLFKVTETIALQWRIKTKK